MRLIVVDASAVVEYLLRTKRAPPIEAVLIGADIDLHVPALADVEVAAALRKALLRRLLDESRARLAIDAYLDLPLWRHGHEALLPRAMALRANLSAYDAMYVALAERLHAALLTADAALSRAAARYVPVA